MNLVVNPPTLPAPLEEDWPEEIPQFSPRPGGVIFSPAAIGWRKFCRRKMRHGKALRPPRFSFGGNSGKRPRRSAGKISNVAN